MLNELTAVTKDKMWKRVGVLFQEMTSLFFNINLQTPDLSFKAAISIALTATIESDLIAFHDIFRFVRIILRLPSKAVFINLDIKNLIRCGHVSKRIRAISQDESLWLKINLYSLGNLSGGISNWSGAA